MNDPRALLDHGPHVDRLFAELGELRGEVTRVRDWLAHQPAGTDPVDAVRAVVRLRELRRGASGIYQELRKAHQIRALPRRTVENLLWWATDDFGELVTDVPVTATGSADRATAASAEAAEVAEAGEPV